MKIDWCHSPMGKQVWPWHSLVRYWVLQKKHAVSFTAKKLMGPLSPQVNVVTPLCLERPFRKKQPFRFGCRHTLVIIDQGGVSGVMRQNVGGLLFLGEPSMARYAAPPPHSKVLLACSMTVSIPGISSQSCTRSIGFAILGWKKHPSWGPPNWEPPGKVVDSLISLLNNHRIPEFRSWVPAFLGTTWLG